MPVLPVRACFAQSGNPLVKLVARLNRRGLCAPPTRNAETVKNHPRGVGSIECVKVNASHVVIQKIVTLFQGEVNAYASDPFRVVFASLQRTQKPGREARAAGQFRDTFESAHGGNRHDPGDNGNVDSGERTAFAEIEEIAVIEKELCDHVVGAGIDFRFEVIHFD
jgi:hypothetical protein